MELVVAVAVSVLTIVFLGSIIALILICRQRLCNHDLDTKPILKYSKDELVTAATTSDDEFHIEEVTQLSPNIEKILKGNAWVYDAGGLAEQCLAILRGCHAVTDKLSGLSFSLVHGDQELMVEVQHATRRVMPRVDDLVRAMYNSRKTIQAALLEARAAALILAINNLVLAFRAAYPRAIEDVNWLKNTLTNLEYNLTVLRDAAHAEEFQADGSDLYSSVSHMSTSKV